MKKVIYIIAGPNGAGKTTFALTSLKKLFGIDEFVNADEIAKGISPLNPDSAKLSAGKIMIKRIRNLIAGNKNFAFETTLAGRNYVKHIQAAQKNGYNVILLFLWLASDEAAIKRVAKRVKEGGHNVPVKTIKQRYRNGISNFVNLYLPIADISYLFDNTKNFKDNIIAEAALKKEISIYNQAKWDKINLYVKSSDSRN